MPLCLFFPLSGVLSAEEPPSSSLEIGKRAATGRLTLDQAVALALQFHPSLRAARATVRTQESLVGVAKADLFPRLDLTAGYRRATSNFAPNPTVPGLSRPGSSGPSSQSFDNYTGSLSLQQRIFDFGKTGAAVQAAKEGVRATQWDEEAVRGEVAVNVKVAYFGLLGSRRLVRVNEETVRQFEEHLAKAEGLFQVGARPKFDVTKARVDLTNARLMLIQAKNAAEVARVTLANAIGLPDRPIGEMEDSLDFNKMEITEAQAVEEALTGRPELRSFGAKRRAGESSIRAAERNYFPVLSGTADYTYRGQDFPLVWNWGLGLNLTFPIFSGFLQQSQLAQARANLTTVLSNEEVLRQNVTLEVRQASLSLQEAEERVRVSDLVVHQAEENLELANGRYQAGVASSVERTDAQVLLTNAKTSQVQALYDYKVAEARLLRAMGRL
ncbi:MAG: TolC family protein [Candidatus Manganitrophaceae bacterium]